MQLPKENIAKYHRLLGMQEMLVTNIPRLYNNWMSSPVWHWR